MYMSDSINELAAALSKAQSQIQGAVKDSKNPFFKSQYADLSSVWEAIRKPLADNGLAIAQPVRGTENGVEVETFLMHSSGQWVADSLLIPVQKMDAQGVGSAITYGRRYGLSAMVGVCQVDDDGNAATASAPITARGGARERLTPDSTEQVDSLASRILDAFEVGDENLAYAAYLEARPKLRDNADAQAAFWDKFNSKQRATLKKMLEADRAASQA